MLAKAFWLETRRCDEKQACHRAVFEERYRWGMVEWYTSMFSRNQDSLTYL